MKMENELRQVDVYIKPSTATVGTLCSFDVHYPGREEPILEDLDFYTAIEKFPLHIFRWNVHYNPKTLNCEYDKSSDKQLCKLLTKE